MGNKDVERFVNEVTAEGTGWTYQLDEDGNYQLRAPDGEGWVTVPKTPGEPDWRAIAEMNLRGLGFTPAEAKKDKAANRQAQIQAQQEKAQEMAALAAQTRADMAQRMARAAISSPGGYGEVRQIDGTLKGWPTTYRYITVEEAEEELKRYDQGCCRRRRLREANIQNWVQILESGAFRLTDSSITYTSCPNKCLANGQHRFWAMQLADRAKLDRHYPNGVPFRVVSEFPPDLVHTLDSGKARDAHDTLDLAHLPLNAGQIATATRLAIAFDRSFIPPGLPWTQFGKVVVTNTELLAATVGPYARMADYVKDAGHLYTQANVIKSAGNVLHFLLRRDTDKPETVDEFFAGVLGDAPAGDPRTEFARFTMVRRGPTARDRNKRMRSNAPGPHQLGLGLRAYALWRMDPDKRISHLKFEKDMKMPRVFNEGMQWFREGLRFPYV
jgi:hypothetical protein